MHGVADQIATHLGCTCNLQLCIAPAKIDDEQQVPALPRASPPHAPGHSDWIRLDQADGTWRIVGPTERGPQRWGGGGEIAVWKSRDEGVTWKKVRDVTTDSPRNNSYVRKVIGAEPDSLFAMLWADGHSDKLSVSRLDFADREGKVVRRLPYDMEREFAVPEVLGGK